MSEDVHIIGGSAAGLFAAYLLARAGKRVQVFDANDVLNSESRTLITTSRLTEVLGFYPRESVCNEIKQIELFSRQRSVMIPMRQPDLVVQRTAMVRLLAARALEAGVEIRGGWKLVSLQPAQKELVLTIRDTHRDRLERIAAKTLIGADGTFSRVAKFATGNGYETTSILQAIVKLPKGYQAKTTQVWFEPQDTPYFYWLIPESQEQAAVGLIAEGGKNAKQKLERFPFRVGLGQAEEPGGPDTRVQIFDMSVAQDFRHGYLFGRRRRCASQDLYGGRIGNRPARRERSSQCDPARDRLLKGAEAAATGTQPASTH